MSHKSITPIVSALALAMALSVSGPAHAYLRAENITEHNYDVAALWVNHHDLNSGCEALVNVYGTTSRIHGVPVAISFDRLALYRNGVEVASIGYMHTNSHILNVGTAVGPS